MTTRQTLPRRWRLIHSTGPGVTGSLSGSPDALPRRGGAADGAGSPGLAVVLLATFAAVERRTRRPLVPAQIWRARSLVAGVLVMLGATGSIAFTARGRARVLQQPMAATSDYAAIAIDVEQIDDHRQPAFEVDAGIGRRWLHESERDALARRMRGLTGLAAP